jgi:hypothetical protein
MGVIVELKPGTVRVRWSSCCTEPDSWEATDRGTLMKPAPSMEGGDLHVDWHGVCWRDCRISER